MSTVVQLIAMARGFLGERMIEAGQKFEFDTVGINGRPRSIPRWAARPGDPRLALLTVKPTADLKPLDAKRAAERKAGHLDSAS